MEVKPLLSYHLMQHLATKDDDTNFLLRATEVHSVWVQVSVLLFSKLGCFGFFNANCSSGYLFSWRHKLTKSQNRLFSTNIIFFW